MPDTNLNNLLKNIRGIIGAIVVIAVLIGAIYGLNSYIETKIDKITNDEQFINKISSRIRPYIIFDSKETILLDMGGLQFLEKIKVVPGDDNTKPPKIIVTPKKYMDHAPLLTCLKLVHMVLSVERGKNLDWEYTLGNFIETKPPRVLPVEQFRLEIISK